MTDLLDIPSLRSCPHFSVFSNMSSLLSGVLMQSYTKPVYDPEYFADLYKLKDDWRKWEREHGEPVNETVLSYIVEYVGKPLNNLIR